MTKKPTPDPEPDLGPLYCPIDEHTAADEKAVADTLAAANQLAEQHAAEQAATDLEETP